MRAAKVAIIFKRWLMPRFNLLKLILVCFLLVIKASWAPLCAQEMERRELPKRLTMFDSLSVRGGVKPVMADSLRAGMDSLALASDSTSRGDSLALANSLAAVDSASLEKKGMLDFPVFSSAKDSTIEDFSGPHKMIYYYGDVKVTYGNMGIEADYMAYDVDKQTVFASGMTDSLGNLLSRPKMIMDGQSYDVDHVYYNFNSRKAKVKNMITQQQEGILHGENLKMMPDKSINITKGKYTVCDLDHPHYYLKMTAAKIITEPKQRTVFGPAYVVVADVPLPLVIPFGFVPQKPQRASGILFPTFGEEQARGFYMRDLGYYMFFGDHLMSP